jgi:hypothetical protein
MESLSFKTVHASVRPARVAIIVDSGDPDWQHTCLRVIEFYSRLWGGGYNIIVPSDGTRIDERFWALLEAFDPDYIFRYQKSFGDLALSHPDRYTEILEKQVDEFAAQADPIDRGAARREIDERLRGTWMSPFEVSKTLQEEIKTRLAPFWFQDWVVNAQPISAGTIPPFHLTDITKIISSTDHPDFIGVVEVSEDLLPRLWYGAATGIMSSTTTGAFERLGIRTEQFTFRDDNISELIEFTIGGEPRSFRSGRSSGRALHDLNTVPFRVSMLQLGLYRSFRYQDWRERIIVIVGSTIRDFCLYYCLSRLRDRVIWILPSIAEKILSGNNNAQMTAAETSFLLHLRNSATRSSQYEGGLNFITCSLDSDQVDSVMQQLNGFRFGGLGGEMGKVYDIGGLARFPLSAVERDNFQRDISLQISEYLSVSPFATPKPKHFAPIHPYEHRYITQLSIVGDAPPKHADLGALTNLTLDSRRVK